MREVPHMKSVRAGGGWGGGAEKREGWGGHFTSELCAYLIVSRLAAMDWSISNNRLSTLWLLASIDWRRRSVISWNWNKNIAETLKNHPKWQNFKIRLIYKRTSVCVNERWKKQPGPFVFLTILNNFPCTTNWKKKLYLLKRVQLKKIQASTGFERVSPKPKFGAPTNWTKQVHIESEAKCCSLIVSSLSRMNWCELEGKKHWLMGSIYWWHNSVK